MRYLMMALFVCLSLVCLVQVSDSSAQETGKHKYPADYRDVETDPQVGEGIQKYAVNGQEGPQKNFGMQPIHDNKAFATFKADRFEHQWREKDEELLLWDVMGWVGNDDHKFFVESEGEYSLDQDQVEEAGVELLYGRTISRFWDLRAGIRHDFKPSPSRSFLALGVQGLAPQWIEIDATGYVSEDGDVSAKIEAEYELLVTQRLALAPRLEAGLSIQDVPEYETWQGITDVTLGCRLMYHLRREFAPYVGVTWNRKVGETAHNIDKEGGDVDSAAFVAGLRFWF
ncbi:copper resistance protein B [Desulfovermiculus halophilus]|uniref:copper resistance protein B n=1 Tax=Desulfovermiculus halophilus TaxID=339722 RepID=UPI00068504C2|nr:copper resistance protein B [Desulfovermiculus halophilus]